MPFNPVNSITGNGSPGNVVATYTTGSTSWNIVSNNLPGSALVGSFPNSLNASAIQAQSLNYTWPYRGGKNLPAVGTRSKVPYGVIGISDIGIVFFSPHAGLSTSGLNGTTWTVNSIEAKIFGEDIYGGSPNGAGVYHYVDSDFITNNAWGPLSAWTSGYRETDGHSKIIGWARDGYPIYGPYGYSNPLVVSTATLMTSGYRTSNKSNRPAARTLVVNGAVTTSTSFAVYSISGVTAGMTLTGNSITTSTKVVRVSGANVFTNVPLTLTDAEIVSASFSVGSLIEDWDYSLTGNPSLDTYNGRYCVTPDYPLGTYAYFITQNSNGAPTFPYIIGTNYYGSLTADSNDSTLSIITASTGTFSPSFQSTITNYILTVNNLNTSVYFTPISGNINSVIVFNNTTTVGSGSVTPTVFLPVGYTTSTIRVTSQYQTTSTYTISINRLKSSNNLLSSLFVDVNELVPDFSSTLTNYTLTVSTSQDNLYIAAVTADSNSTITINGSAAISGLVYLKDLVFGRNVISIVVTAQDNSTRTYTINVTRLSTVALLSNIVVDQGTIAPSFSQGTFFYNVFVLNTVTSIRVKGTLLDDASTLYVDNVLTTSTVFSLPAPLKLGVNAVDVRIVSSDGTTTQFYRVTVKRGFSSTATLSSLVLTAGALVPTFNSTITNYVATVTNNISSISVIPTASEEYSKIATNNVVGVSGEESDLIPLTVGNNNINVTVTAPDEIVQRTYTVVVTRQGSSNSLLSNLAISNAVLSPSFNSTTTNYSATVGYTISSISITPTLANSNASIRINNISATNGSQTSVPLSIGTNTILTVVTAQDGITTSTYRLVIARKANYNTNLADIQISSGVLYPASNGIITGEGFSTSVTNYISYASHYTTSTDLVVIKEDIGASLKINGVSTTSGATTTIPLVGYNILNTTTNRIEWVGNTTINVTCIAADPFYVQTSTITVVRLANNISTLTNLILSTATLTPSFTFDNTDYFIGLPYSFVTPIQFKPFTTDPTARVYVDNEEVASGTFSTGIKIPVGNTEVRISVISGSGASTVYLVSIDRAAKGLSDDATLARLELSTGTYYPSFKSTTTVYNSNFTYDVSSIRIKPTKSFTRASIQVNGVAVASGEFSNNIAIPVGRSTATIMVTAEDLVTKKYYYLNLARTGSSNPYLSKLYVNSGYLEPAFEKNVTRYTVNVSYDTKTVAVKPFVENNQCQVSINTLGIPPGVWSQPLNLNVGNNIIKVVTLAGDGITGAVYQINFIRASAKLTNPVQLFLQDGTGRVTANYYPDTSLLRIFTVVNSDYAYHGNFPNSTNSGTLAGQNIEVIYPYRGGQEIPSLNVNPRPVNGIIGITLIGIPFHDPNTAIKVVGNNNTTWNLDAVLYNTSDQYGGRPSPTGEYYYTDDRFIRNNAWAITDTWLGDYIHDDGHSRIIGFAADGYPIYGPYGYSNPLNSFSTVTSMTSGYTTRSQPNRPVDQSLLITLNSVSTNTISVANITGVYAGMQLLGLTTTTLDVFVISVQDNLLTVNSPVDASAFSIITGTYKLGTFVEDWVYTKTGSLDAHNGRLCVTPDYPAGTYAYFTTPTYPYVVGNTFFGDLNTKSLTPTSPPIWTTPIGFIVTATELVSFSRSVSANGGGVSYKLISGSLPSGLSLTTSTGFISGIPTAVTETTKSTFVIRALNQYGVSDRKFSLDVRGATPPVIRTPGPYPLIGPSGEPLLINKQFVDFQFTATYDILAPGKPIVFFIEDGDGKLPPGLELSQSGRLYGQVLDTLSLYYRAGSDGKYDQEGFDVNPYEHESTQAFGISGKYVNKTYQIYLTAANGSATVKAQYRLRVYDPSDFINDGGYPIPPQWMTPTDLGTVRSNTAQVIQLETYDCDPGNGTITYDWNIVNQNNFSILPPGLNLNPNTGVMSGNIQYSPTYSSTYTFKVRVTKHSTITGTSQYRDRTFTLTVLGAVLSRMTWITDTIVGTLHSGEQSELSVKAVHEDTGLKITYSLESGTLPTGLSFTTDGAIQGQVAYGITPRAYSITVKATDSNLSSQLVKTFNIVIAPYLGKVYTKILLTPLLAVNTRATFAEFINDQNVFDPELMYRPFDPAFGVQKTIQFVLEYGIEKLKLADYVPAMQDYFSRRKLYFGSLKSAFALDDNNNKIYEVVYLEINDNSINSQGDSIGSVVVNGNVTVYPPSIDNMRSALELIADVDEYLLPKFMRTVQDDSGIPLGRILCMPICYCLPGNSQTLIRRIEAYGINFKNINFDIDRLTVLNTVDNSVAKYLLFPNREI